MVSMAPTRRVFLASAASAALASAKSLSTIGVQLYTLRSVLPEKPLETLRELESIGYKEVEAVGGSIGRIWDSLKQTSLKPVSLHLDTSLFLRQQEKLPAALEDAAQRGFRYVVCPYIGPQDRGGVAVIERMAAVLNQAGEKCRAAGMTLAYHNHAFEFEAAGEGTLLDVLFKNTDQKLVTLELDMFWAQVAGVDPVSLLEKHKGRVPLMHLKDLKAGAEKRLNEGVPRDWFMEVGKGSINVAAVLRAAEKCGVKHFFVEQDQTSGPAIESLRASFDYLRKLSY